jgi:acetyl-CoA synthetase
VLPPGDSYDAIRAAFRWRVPERYNMGADCCDKWADGSGRLALCTGAGTAGRSASPSTR